MSKITDIVTELARPVVQQAGCELWDVEYVKEAGQWFLRVYIDKDGGVSIDDCEAVSRALDPVLDERDPIETSYTFEVSSAGAERSLKRPSDFERFLGSFVEVRLYKARDGVKEFTGDLAGYEDGAVTIEQNGRRVTFAKGEVANVRLRIRL
ncbi:MAG: ribosome maturation factor RimP [Oscillospiraceae bacterium]|jgi:ribosome maturation factor RimP|nr:ribosome maturation factor RimP [Oscillospiraceae bacterium]MBQ8929283.1 ribosome maturation factor RimP [Oscillospiraceae bacterium]MBR6430650.1 ribosome maturation factor RimP [Oscillospiraceae bacterium]